MCVIPVLPSMENMTVEVTGIATTSVGLSFKTMDLNADTMDYYNYLIKYRKTDDCVYMELNEPHTVNDEYVSVKLVSLTANTQYTGSVIPQRHIDNNQYNNKNTQDGLPSEAFSFTTSE